ncbi:trypsin-like serine protease [Kribbella antibiotica]|uniref:Trypsin-like serine protease n=1 Tax=Kribbella antibiotica TaxID=190195 RepID=A0A4R4ZPM3_9ACTN|nr:trypsin-like serine protease [Kribbella antibiotica]TDD60881.1 trypsin-like serine protease [Kribbella antibiotica]
MTKSMLARALLFLALVAAALVPTATPAQAVKGGEHTTHPTYPWSVVITRPGSASPWKVSCGGALLAPNKVLTAAHCMDPSIGDFKEKTVIWGRTDLRTTDGKVAKITSYWKHPSYQWGSLAGDDIAVLTLDQNLGAPGDYLKVATAAEAAEVNKIGNQTVLGGTWGRIGPGTGEADHDPVMKKATLPIIDPVATGGCKDIGWSFTPDKQLCNGPIKNDALGTCGGDSGAPVVLNTANGWRQVSLIESGDSNCGGPQVTSKLTNYEALISEQVGTEPPPPTGGVTNGGFEAGTAAGWSAGGTGNAASVVNTGARTGTYAARLGSTTATNGESTYSQTFAVPEGSSRLSLWYSMTCPDTVSYAWARVTLKDNTAGTTTTPLAKTCTNGQGWKQVTASVITGHSYTLTLVNRDDNHPSDPVHTLYDDVTLGATLQQAPAGQRLQS